MVQKKLRTPPRMESSQDQTDEGNHNSNVPAEGSLKDVLWAQKWLIMGWREVGVHDRVRAWGHREAQVGNGIPPHLHIQPLQGMQGAEETAWILGWERLKLSSAPGWLTQAQEEDSTSPLLACSLPQQQALPLHLDWKGWSQTYPVRGEGAQMKWCREPRCSPRVKLGCRGTFGVTSKVLSTVSNFKTERETSLETL